MKITVTVEADDNEAAAVHLLMIAKLVDLGMTVASGFNSKDDTAWNLETEDDEWPHGDYHDEMGNLLHVHNSHVVHVTKANANADTENINVPVDEWIEGHGKLTYIRAETPEADS